MGNPIRAVLHYAQCSVRLVQSQEMTLFSLTWFLPSLPGGNCGSWWRPRGSGLRYLWSFLDAWCMVGRGLSFWLWIVTLLIRPSWWKPLWNGPRENFGCSICPPIRLSLIPMNTSGMMWRATVSEDRWSPMSKISVLRWSPDSVTSRKIQSTFALSFNPTRPVMPYDLCLDIYELLNNTSCLTCFSH